MGVRISCRLVPGSARTIGLAPVISRLVSLILLDHNRHAVVGAREGEPDEGDVAGALLGVNLLPLLLEVGQEGLERVEPASRVRVLVLLVVVVAAPPRRSPRRRARARAVQLVVFLRMESGSAADESCFIV